MASGTRSFDNLDDQNVDWSLGLSFFGDFDPNISFLDDSALLPGFTPDWADCSGENPHPHFSPKHHENSLTSHEASSDEGEARITGTSRNTQAPRKRGRPRKVQHASPSTTSAAVTNTPNQSRQPVSSNIDRMLDDTPYIYDDTDTGLSASPLHSVAQNTSTSTNTDEAARKAQLQPSLSTSGGSATLSSRSSRCVARRTVVHLSGGDNDSADYLPGRVKSSVTGRKKAPEEARSVLMDWINDNKDHPYPTRAQKGELAASTGLTVPQIVHWMSNVRKRRLIPLMRGKREPASKIDRKFLEEIAMRSK